MRIPSLDGLRAVSICLVLVSHSAIQAGRSGNGPFWLWTSWGIAGVTVFFGISGFLITTLLVRELRNTGRVDLRAFFVRRAFRILPPLWAFLAISVAIKPFPAWQPLSAALFLTDYLDVGVWWLGHTWSLSVEEQFYVLWPLAFWWLGARRGETAVATLLALMPLVRVAAYFALPGLRSRADYTFHTVADTILVGCLVALLLDRTPTHPVIRLLRSRHTALASAAIVFVVSPWLAHAFGGRYMLTVGTSVRAFAVGSIVLWSIENAGTAVGRILNSRVATHIGVISYSLYLWQQPFFDPSVSGTWVAFWPVALAGAFGAAELSHRLVEKPVLALRLRLTAKPREAEAARLSMGG